MITGVREDTVMSMCRFAFLDVWLVHRPTALLFSYNVSLFRSAQVENGDAFFEPVVYYFLFRLSLSLFFLPPIPIAFAFASNRCPSLKIWRHTNHCCAGAFLFFFFFFTLRVHTCSLLSLFGFLFSRFFFSLIRVTLMLNEMIEDF